MKKLLSLLFYLTMTILCIAMLFGVFMMYKEFNIKYAAFILLSQLVIYLILDLDSKLLDRRNYDGHINE